ncbi:hypothetical protein Zm00014a_007195 [Zea mays]|uniref:Uncharacterized protein n=1 Tax=Zea mays TaxID=4577 RepID=A0A3L6EF02_MAIZE|nr:hypothetical protein Zm00014a_007195 [Zea mays]
MHVHHQQPSTTASVELQKQQQQAALFTI